MLTSFQIQIESHNQKLSELWFGWVVKILFGFPVSLSLSLSFSSYKCSRFRIENHTLPFRMSKNYFFFLLLSFEKHRKSVYKKGKASKMFNKQNMKRRKEKFHLPKKRLKTPHWETEKKFLFRCERLLFDLFRIRCQIRYQHVDTIFRYQCTDNFITLCSLQTNHLHFVIWWATLRVQCLLDARPNGQHRTGQYGVCTSSQSNLLMNSHYFQIKSKRNKMTNLTLLSHRNIPAISAPICMRAGIHRRIILLRPLCFGLVALHLLVLLLDFGQRFRTKL